MASVECALAWDSPHASHTDRYLFDKVDFWRDVFPNNQGDELNRLAPGDVAETSLTPGAVAGPYDSGQIKTLDRERVALKLRSGHTVRPHRGRFYPRGLAAGATDSFPGDIRPFRYLEPDSAHCALDLNHPLARFGGRFTTRVIETLEAREEHGGRCNDILHDMASNGPGLQAALADADTDFFTDSPFTRDDEFDDSAFYLQPRLVNHIDTTAIAHITALYRRFLRPGMQVLDLMSSWTSHLPSEMLELEVTGLGMNAVELERNERLSKRIVHDLNRDAALPLAAHSFDIALCTVSVEYLVHPVEVFSEVARVLRPGAPFVVTFSERWFPPKVIRLWTELHAFERMGLVIDYFRKTGRFGDLHTESVRGYPRPADDKYARSLRDSDPVYAVWGYAQTH